ncbi:MAG: nitroreductase family protein [Candidatus Thorarchaeota archaeon]|nr:nitroreductase family protein [Candidatus Thorarchaeota archaeon]
MDVQEAILKRRSIREFKSEALPSNAIDSLLRAAMAAPSAGDQRPWQFIVVTKREGIDAIIEAYPYAKVIKNAPAAIVVCFDRTLEKYKGYWTMDCSAAVENMLIAAAGMGLGSLWLSVYPEEKYHNLEILHEELNIPTTAIPFCIVPVGYIAKEPEAREKFDSSRIHHEKW